MQKNEKSESSALKRDKLEVLRLPAFFSVVTVTRNNLDGLKRTAFSVLGQQFVAFEWIVIDGASSDGTQDFLRELRFEKLKWRSKRDAGIYHAMNKGLASARGEYIIFMNGGDELYSSNCLALLQDSIVETSPLPDLVFGSSVMQLPNGLRILHPARSAKHIRYGLPALHQSIVFRRTLHDKTPYDQSFSVSSDYATVARMLKEGASTLVSPVVVSVNEVGGDSTSHRKPAVLLSDVWRAQRDILDLTFAERLICLTRLAFIRIVAGVIETKAFRILQPIFNFVGKAE